MTDWSCWDVPDLEIYLEPEDVVIAAPRQAIPADDPDFGTLWSRAGAFSYLTHGPFIERHLEVVICSRTAIREDKKFQLLNLQTENFEDPIIVVRPS